MIKVKAIGISTRLLSPPFFFVPSPPLFLLLPPPGDRGGRKKMREPEDSEGSRLFLLLPPPLLPFLSLLSFSVGREAVGDRELSTAIPSPLFFFFPPLFFGAAGCEAVETGPEIVFSFLSPFFFSSFANSVELWKNCRPSCEIRRRDHSLSSISPSAPFSFFLPFLLPSSQQAVQIVVIEHDIEPARSAPLPFSSSLSFLSSFFPSFFFFSPPLSKLPLKSGAMEKCKRSSTGWPFLPSLSFPSPPLSLPPFSASTVSMATR